MARPRSTRWRAADFADLAFLVDPAPIPAVRQAHRPQVDGAHDEQVRAEALGKAERFLGGRSGTRTEVRRQQDRGRVVGCDHRSTLAPDADPGSDRRPGLAGRVSRVVRCPVRGARLTACRIDPPSPSETLAADALEALDEATRAIAEVRDLEATLQLIVDRVRDLVDAQYAALGIAAADGAIERFITSGITDEQRALIGPLPRGHGLLGPDHPRGPVRSHAEHREPSGLVRVPAPPPADGDVPRASRSPATAARSATCT